MTVSLTAILMILFDQLEATIMIIVVDNLEELSQVASVARAHRVEDLGQPLVREVSGQRVDGFNESERSGPDAGT